MPIRITLDDCTNNASINAFDSDLMIILVCVVFLIIYNFKPYIMRFIIIMSFLFVSSFVSAQSFTVATSNSEVESVKLTIDGKDFQAFSSRTGSIYIMRTSSKTGKEYKSYLGHKSDKIVVIDGVNYPVWSNKAYDKWDVSEDVIFYAYRLGKNGYPAKTNLKKN
jgi:hypothetical protein